MLLPLLLLPLFALPQSSSSKSLTFHPIGYHLDSTLVHPASSLRLSDYSAETSSSLHLSLKTSSRTVSRPIDNNSLREGLVETATAQVPFASRTWPKDWSDGVEWEDFEMEIPDLEDMVSLSSPLDTSVQDRSTDPSPFLLQLPSFLPHFAS